MMRCSTPLTRAPAFALRPALALRSLRAIENIAVRCNTLQGHGMR